MKIGRLMTPSKHFHLELVADGVYAAIHHEGGWAISNAGIIDLGGRTLVFDTFLTPQAARDLKTVAEALTDNPVNILVNSHFHNDHIWGNQAFSTECDIISTTETRRLITTAGLQEYNYYKETTPAHLKDLEARELPETGGMEGQTSSELSYYQAISATLPVLKIRLPNLTFAQRLTLHGAFRSVELISFRGGHTKNDTLLYLPETGILFMSDLLFIGCHPYLVDGIPGSFPGIAKAIRDLKPKTLVPGHGPVGGPHDLEVMEEYVYTCERLAHQMVHAGDPLDKASEIPIPQAYGGWDFPAFFEANLRALYNHYFQEEASPPLEPTQIFGDPDEEWQLHPTDELP